MHEDDPLRREAGTELASGPLSSRRSTLLKLLAGSGAAYAVPLAASFSMGGLSLPAQAGTPSFGNQCYFGNQPIGRTYYRIAVRAEFSIDGATTGRLTSAAFLVGIQEIVASDETGWTAIVTVWFDSEGLGPTPLFGAPYSLVVSNVTGTFALGFPLLTYSSVRGGGPLVLTQRRIRQLTADRPFSRWPIFVAGVTYGADISALTQCGVLRIRRLRPNATLLTVGYYDPIIPSGSLPPATVPSGEL